MKNWSVDIGELEKDPDAFARWRLEQMINYGLDGEKISETELIARWDELTLDPAKRRFLGFLLWGESFLIRGK